MAFFGLPGGAEWVVIAIVAVLLFVPGAGLVWVGYLLGRRSAESGKPASAATDTKDPDVEDD